VYSRNPLNVPDASAARGHWTVALRVLAVATAIMVVGAMAPPTRGYAAPGSAEPIRAAFYYPWYPETEAWATRYTPTLSKYDSSNPAVLAKHVSQAKYAGLNAFISSYWGKGTRTANRLPALLKAAGAQNFQVAPYYEPASLSPAPTAAAVKADFDALATLSTDKAWLKVDGKPVLFVYNTGTEASCAGIARLAKASAGRFYLNAKVFVGYRNCSTKPHSWHQYGPAVAYDQQASYASTVSPGFFKFSEKDPRLPRNLARFKADLKRQVASGARWQLLTTFNEWGEGSSVEPATQWKSGSSAGIYLDAMRAAYTGQAPTPT
jgi:hypothetical protein